MGQGPLKAPFFHGEFELTVDSKNRLLVPAEVRRAIDPAVHGTALFLIVGPNRVPWMYPDRYYEILVSQTPTDITPDEDLLAYAQLKFAMASRIEWDAQGRVVMPEKTLKRTGIQKDVTVIGVRDHLELWNRADWESRFEQLFANSAEIESKAKKARQDADARVTHRRLQASLAV